MYGAEHAALSSTLNLEARALLASGEHLAAEPVLVRALGIQRGIAPIGDPAAEAIAALLVHTREQLARL